MCWVMLKNNYFEIRKYKSPQNSILRGRFHCIGTFYQSLCGLVYYLVRFWKISLLVLNTLSTVWFSLLTWMSTNQYTDLVLLLKKLATILITLCYKWLRGYVFIVFFLLCALFFLFRSRSWFKKSCLLLVTLTHPP